MAEIFNEQRILGVRIVADGTTMHNGLPVIGIRDSVGVLFSSNLRALGIDVLTGDEVVWNDQPVRGFVLISDGRQLYNGRQVMPFWEQYADETLSLVSRFDVAPDYAWKRYYDDLIRGLVADGTWPLIDRLQIYGSYAAQPGRQNVRQDLYNSTVHGSPVFTAEAGYAGDALAAYLSQGYAPAVSPGVSAQNSQHVFVWSNTESVAPATYAETGNSKVAVTLRSSTGNIGIRMHVASAVTEAVTSSLGMWGAVRAASNQHLIYHDGLLFATEASTSSAPAADEVYDLARNVSGVLTTPTNRQLYAVSYGAALTAAQVAMLNGRIQAFKDKVSAFDLVTLDGQLVTNLGTYTTYESP